MSLMGDGMYRARFLTRSTLGVLVLVLVLASGTALPHSKQNKSPTVLISLPTDIASENVQIIYFMTGPFGGYGGYVKPQRDLHSYQIEASVEGRPAESIKVLVYATGCNFQTLELSLSRDSAVHKEFVCDVLPEVTLRGQIPEGLIRGRKAELMIMYVAHWACEFFGLADCLVPQFQIALVPLDENTTFRVLLPDFGIRDPSHTATLRLILRDPKTWNPIAPDLVPELPEYRSEALGLKIASSYPDALKFIPNPNAKTF